MKHKKNSFLEYLESDRFYSKIEKSIFSWCLKNKDLLLDKIDGYNVSYINEIEELELVFINVWIDQKVRTKIDFDIAIEVTASVEGVAGKYRDRDSYSSRLWVMVRCSGSLDKKLNDFYILGVDEFNKSSPKKPLSGDLVPIMKKTSYSKYADEILAKYYYPHYPESKTEAIAINIDELAKRMGLTVIDTSISSDNTIFGQIFFNDTEVQIYSRDRQLYEKRNFKKNTVLVDSNAAFLWSYGSRNMTIAHECVHSYFHREAFLFAQMFDENLSSIQCQVNGKMKGSESNTAAKWMEIQANALAPYILMPEEAFVSYAEDLFKIYVNNSTIGSNGINIVIDELAKTFEVTIYAARKRLIDLGFIEAIGAYNWIDNHYVRPYTFKKGSLSSNETFTVSYKDVYKKIISDSNFAPLAFTSYYVFVENHLCINHADYIEKDTSGNLILSYYALTHMDECCVKFEYKPTLYNDESNLGLMCYLCRDTSKEIEFDLEIAKNQTYISKDPKLLKRFRVHKDNTDEVVRNISHLPFGEVVNYLMNYLDISIKELELDSGLDERTIRRYVNGENKKPDKRSVVALLRAINLPFEIVNIALRQAGISFRSGDAEDDALLSAMQLFRGAHPEDVNNFMTNLGFGPLTKEKK